MVLTAWLSRRESRAAPQRRNLMLRVVGVDPKLLTGDDNPSGPADRTRYTVMGMSVCVTAIFSGCALVIALTLATGRFNAVYPVLGLIWALFIFNVDRWVVSSVDYGRLDESGSPRWNAVFGVSRRVALLVVRLSIAVLIGVSISEPVIMLVFSHELEAKFDDGHARRTREITDEVNADPYWATLYANEYSRLEVAKKEVSDAATAVAQANSALDAEQGGWAGTGQIGFGDRTNERRGDLKRAQERYDKAVTDRAKAQFDYDIAKVSSDEKRAGELTRRLDDLNRPHGIGDRERALAELARQDPSVRVMQNVMRGLILLVDLAPLLLKLTSPRSPHERNLKARVRDQLVRHDRRLALAADEEDQKDRYRHDRSVAHDKVVVDNQFRIEGEREARDTDFEIRSLVASHAERVRGSGLDAVDDVGFHHSSQPEASPSGGPSTIDPQESAVWDRAATGPVVDQQWQLLWHIENADLALAWRTPYLARHVSDTSATPELVAVKRVDLPERRRSSTGWREVNSLPSDGTEISPYVTRVLHAGYDPKFGWFVVTPFYANGTVQKLMDEATDVLTLSRALTITEQLLRGLLAAFTHDGKNLVHFDIKPSNIAFDDAGQVRIIDWGLAEAIDRDHSATLDGAHGFSLWYAPPEQINAKPGGNSNWVSPLCDIRAVGAVLYAMITGQPPLKLEAKWAGLLDDEGVKPGSDNELASLITGAKPVPLSDFFAVNGLDTDALAPLSQLLGQWLHPRATRRVGREGDEPVHESALRELAAVVEGLRRADVVHMEVGAHALPNVPAPRPMAMGDAPNADFDFGRNAATAIESLPKEGF
ncbi:DUF4407 domain-containing protein [Lentzea sp.]|uniref:DUF4407 domain-containing protein n=1 Tax=Lentzea sp. TaxID=56099 RepID=UPI002ED3FEF3